MTIVCVDISQPPAIGVVFDGSKLPNLPDPAAAEPFTHAFRRVVVPEPERAALIKHFQDQAQADPDFYRGFRSQSGRGVYYCSYIDPSNSPFPVVLKDTHGEVMQGDDTTAFRSLMADFKSRCRAEERSAGVTPGCSVKPYEVHLPIIYGRVASNLIAMEHIQEKSADILAILLRERGEERVLASLRNALDQYEADLERHAAVSRQLVLVKRQASQVIVAGHTNPSQIEQGKWVFFVPYDLY